MTRILSGLTPGNEAGTAIGTADHWCPIEGPQATFGNRAAAENLIKVPYLRDQGLTGQGVNVVIVDQGLNAAGLGTVVEGWPIPAVGGMAPGATPLEPGKPHGGHGMLVAASIRAVAPKAKLFDLPMLPKTKIPDVTKFFDQTANEAFSRMLIDIDAKRKDWPGHWIIVNAWAIFDTRTDTQNYANGPNHQFNRLVNDAVNAGHDVVFAAGNCGAFCPDPRCGPQDQGPGRSIIGASSNPNVVTVAAIGCDKTWLGYSSQGPGQPAFGPDGQKKPDLCAPSAFVETLTGTANGGTSTATALVAGVMAALRGRWGKNVASPVDLKNILNDTATPLGNGWNARTGHGILNAEGAAMSLSNRK